MTAAIPLTAPAVSSMTRGEYDAIRDRVNFSTLKLMGRSPAHYRERIQNPPGPDSDAMRVGRASHLAVLEPDKFRTECIQWTEGRRAGKAWEAFAAEHAHQEILTPPEWETCLAIQRAVRASDSASRYLMAGAAEQTVLWEQTSAVEGFAPATHRCKGRLDWVCDSAIVDLKTTKDASPEAFGRSCFNFAYHAQAAFYSDGYEAATGRALPFVVIAVETTAPFTVQPYRVPEEVIDMGRELYWQWLDRLDLCRRESRWPGYGDGELPLTLPRWAMPQNDDISDLGLT